MVYMKKLLLLFITFSSLNAIFAQKVDFSKEEQVLTNIFTKISRFETEENNIKNNEKFIALMDSILHIPASFNHNFPDSLFGDVKAPDESFRIITWNMLHVNGTYENFGFIQTNPESKEDFRVERLTDKRIGLKYPQQKVLRVDKWYGANYYQIVEVKKKGRTYYTLIGWNPNNLYTQEKVIDMLFFKKGNAIFGSPMLEVKGRGSQRRVIFEYSAKNSMMLRWEKKKDMIVFDHLAPSQPRYEGIYEFYGPDFSVDGYRYKKKKWRYQNDIDVRNPRTHWTQYLRIPFIYNITHRNRN